MKAITSLLAGGIAIAALASAAPAAAQYYPGYGNPGYGYGYPGAGIGGILGQVLGGGYGGYGGYGYGANSQVAVNQCANAVQARLSGGYGGYGYNGYASPYGYGYGAGGRVLGISRVEPRGDGGLTVRGVATSGRSAGYGYSQNRPDLTWRCRTDPRGLVYDVNVSLAQPAYGNGYGYAPPAYTPYNNYNYDYSQYGYSRY